MYSTATRGGDSITESERRSNSARLMPSRMSFPLLATSLRYSRSPTNGAICVVPRCCVAVSLRGAPMTSQRNRVSPCEFRCACMVWYTPARRFMTQPDSGARLSPRRPVSSYRRAHRGRRPTGVLFLNSQVVPRGENRQRCWPHWGSLLELNDCSGRSICLASTTNSGSDFSARLA